MSPAHAPPLPWNPDTEPQSEQLSARAREWLHTRDPRSLWPALDPSLLQPSADAIGRAVASLIRGTSTDLGSPGGEDAYAIGVAALLSGTGPLLGHWMEKGSLDVSDALAPLLAQHLAHGRLRTERIAREVAPALSSLVAADVIPFVIKGFHTAHVYFAEPGLRPLSDIDVLVQPSEIGRTEATLRESGFTPSQLIERPYKRNWFPQGHDDRIWSIEMFDARDRWKLELHSGLSFGELPRFGLRLDAGLAASAEWRVHGVPVRVPVQPYLTAILATHLAGELHQRCLLRVVELILVIRRDRALGLLDWVALETLLEQSGGTRFVYPALSLVERLAPGTIDPGLLSRARRDSTPLARAASHRRTPTNPILEDRPFIAERLMWIRSPTHAIRSIGYWLNPAPDRPWRDALALYHSRLARLLAGRASWMPERKHS